MINPDEEKIKLQKSVLNLFKIESLMSRYKNIIPLKVAILAAFFTLSVQLKTACLKHVGNMRPKIKREELESFSQIADLAIHNKWPRKETLTCSCDTL